MQLPNDLQTAIERAVGTPGLWDPGTENRGGDVRALP
jgi:hypothetical protein